MKGYLDDRNAAFLTLDLAQGPLDFEIDTGFSGTLVVGLSPHRLEIDYGQRTVRLVVHRDW